MSKGYLDDTLDRKPSATQSVAQDFPSRAYTDRMGLQDPTCYGLVRRGERPDPKRTNPVEEAPGLFPRHVRLPEMKQCCRPPCGQRLYYPLGAIDGLKGAGIFAAENTNDAMVTPSEI